PVVDRSPLAVDPPVAQRHLEGLGIRDALDAQPLPRHLEPHAGRGLVLLREPFVPRRPRGKGDLHLRHRASEPDRRGAASALPSRRLAGVAMMRSHGGTTEGEVGGSRAHDDEEIIEALEKLVNDDVSPGTFVVLEADPARGYY